LNNWINHIASSRVCSELKSQLKRDGYVKLPVRFPESDCKTVRECIDAMESGDHETHSMESGDNEIHYGDTEFRVWDLEKKQKSVARFQSELDLYLSTVTGRHPKLQTTLGIRNLAIPGGKFREGRWHIDSFMPQFKAFCFLSDVSDRNGPLTLILDTHVPRFKFTQLIRGIYFGISDAFVGSRRYTKLNDNYIESLIANGCSLKELTCSAGDIFIVNTSAIHRAKPCEHGKRYALTSYYKSFF